LKFVERLLEAGSKVWKEGRPDRYHSYLSKMMKCAFQFQNPLYEYFLNELKKYSDLLDTYELLAFAYILPRAKSQSSVCESEIDFVVRELKKMNH
jgi:Zn-dependent M32 family carboxypeptidase